jgi:hypothetical protein
MEGLDKWIIISSKFQAKLLHKTSGVSVAFLASMGRIQS